MVGFFEVTQFKESNVNIFKIEDAQSYIILNFRALRNKNLAVFDSFFRKICLNEPKEGIKINKYSCNLFLKYIKLTTL